MIKRLVLLGCLLALVATASPSSASAEDDYPARIPTRTDVTVRPVIDSGVSFVIEVAVQANSPVDPTGTITATVTRLSDQGGDRASVSRSSARRGPSAPGEQVWTTSVAYTGGETSIAGPTLNEVGRYRVVATFEPDLRSVFRGSQGGATLRVLEGSGPDDGDGDEDGDNDNDNDNTVAAACCPTPAAPTSGCCCSAWASSARAGRWSSWPDVGVPNPASAEPPSWTLAEPQSAWRASTASR